MHRPESIQALLPVQTRKVLDFLNDATKVEDLTDLQQHRPDLSEKDLVSFSIGARGAQNLIDARTALPGGQFRSLEEVLAVSGIGEDKVLDIVEFIWQPAEEILKQVLYRTTLGENWTVNYWRYSLSPTEFEQLNNDEALLQSFVADKVFSIAREKHDSYLIGKLAKELLKKSPADRIEGLTAEIQFASWWMRFDEDNWFNFETIRRNIAPFLGYFNLQRGAYVDLVFYRSFLTAGTIVDGITPDDLVVSINPAEYTITIWGIGLFD